MPTSFPHIVLCLFTFPLLLLQLLRNYYLYFFHCYHYYHTTLLLNTLLQILSYPGVVELTTQLLILKNILWLPLCRINKFWLNTLPSKNVAIPYTCGLSRLFSGAVAGEHSSILWVTLSVYKSRGRILYPFTCARAVRAAPAAALSRTEEGSQSIRQPKQR